MIQTPPGPGEGEGKLTSKVDISSNTSMTWRAARRFSWIVALEEDMAGQEEGGL